MSQNEEFDVKDRTLRSRGVLGMDEEAEGAVGGFADMKKDGIAAMEDCLILSSCLAIMNHFTDDNSCVQNHIWHFRFVRSP
jgi:hypothetical protein